MKKGLQITFTLGLVLILTTIVNAQLPIDWTKITGDNAFGQLFDPIMQICIIVGGYLAKLIPALQKWNKAQWTLVVIGIIGVISVWAYKVPIDKVLLNALSAILIYNNILKQASDSPVLEK